MVCGRLLGTRQTRLLQRYADISLAPDGRDLPRRTRVLYADGLGEGGITGEKEVHLRGMFISLGPLWLVSLTSAR